MSGPELPPCVQSMACYCAGHARGNPYTHACDTSEITGVAWVVVRVNRDSADTHAVECEGDLPEALRRALDLAMPDKGSRVEYAIVTTDDGGWARLMRPARWISDATVRAALATHHAEALGGSDWEAGAGPSSERTP